MYTISYRNSYQHRWFDDKRFCEPPLGMQEDELVLCIVGWCIRNIYQLFIITYK